ncbi:lysine/arginine/ornithine ABC transporter substrate-binding protein ArgT [Klebsiella sp. 2680]|uniref:lysine/arginine/ornithine ABC transporter substrate-binding protein ArgT n=1 Tax=Klebsiella sp. 2680 TaxID=2018037 RepID=UPI00115BDB64|nr:lysine/arginine/ornithine ABC transporter substrate-binding protein ArgT [Klebsiella sp. 2680]
MKKKHIALALLAYMTTCSVYAELPKTLRIGSDPTYAPFSTKNNKGQLVGFDIDLGNEICKRINIKCTWIASDFDSLIPSLKAKKIDAIISSLSITEKREKEIDFSDKLYAADSRLIAKKGSPITPDLATLKGKHIGVQQGSIQETYADAEWRPNGVDIVSYPGQDQIYSDLEAGRLDATFQDEVAGGVGFLKQPAGKDFSFAGPTVRSIKYFGVGTGIGLRKGNDELKAAFNKAIGDMRKDGTYDKLAKKYFDFNIYGE